MSHLSYGLRGNYWRAFEFPLATKDQWRAAVTGQAANSIRRCFPWERPWNLEISGWSRTLSTHPAVQAAGL